MFLGRAEVRREPVVHGKVVTSAESETTRVDALKFQRFTRREQDGSPLRLRPQVFAVKVKRVVRKMPSFPGADMSAIIHRVCMEARCRAKRIAHVTAEFIVQVTHAKTAVNKKFHGIIEIPTGEHTTADVIERAMTSDRRSIIKHARAIVRTVAILEKQTAGQSTRIPFQAARYTAECGQTIQVKVRPHTNIVLRPTT